MRYAVATLIAAFMLFAGIALGGAGHGWVSGAFGCFALAPLSFFTSINALSISPSQRGALAGLAAGLAVCSIVVVATIFQGVEYFWHYWRMVGILGILVGLVAYLNWLLMCVVALFRVQRVPVHGT